LKAHQPRDLNLISKGCHIGNHPDIVLIVCGQKSISFTYPADINVQTLENEKLLSMYNMLVRIIPIVIGHFGVMATCCQEFIQHIPQFTTSFIYHLQKAALLERIHS